MLFIFLELPYPSTGFVSIRWIEFVYLNRPNLRPKFSNWLFIGLDNMRSYYVAWKTCNYYFISPLNISTTLSL